MLLLVQVAIVAAKSAADIHCFSDLKDARGPMDPCPNGWQREFVFAAKRQSLSEL